MLNSIDLQSMTTQARQEIALIVTGLEEAANIEPSDYDNLETHVFAALGILKTNIGRLEAIESALGERPRDYTAQPSSE